MLSSYTKQNDHKSKAAKVFIRYRVVFSGILFLATVGLLLYDFVGTGKASNPNLTDFVIAIQTDNSGMSDSTSFTIPTNPNYTYNYNVDWNDDGIVDESGLTGDVTHDFSVAGNYTIRISGMFPAIYFNDFGDKLKLTSIHQWGNQVWQSFNAAFEGCSEMTSDATDAPDLSQVTDMSAMFMNTSNFNSDISAWDTSHVTNMSSMFQSAPFSQPLNSWNVGNVTDMNGMFAGSQFNQPLDNWDTSKVTDMGNMFNGSLFTQPLNSWNVGNVTTMSSMFRWSAFNQPLDNWDTSKVTDMSWMFGSVSPFNQPIGNWNVGNVTNMSGMFIGATTFNQPLDNWDTSKVTAMANMFYDAKTFNQPLNSWDTSSLSTIAYMFSGASAFNQPLNSWNVGNVVNLEGTFRDAVSFNQPLSSWNTSKVEDMNYTFSGATSFNHSLATWDVHSVRSYGGSYAGMSGMLSNSNMDGANYDVTIASWGSQAVKNTITLGAAGRAYCAASAARATLINTHSWTITGDRMCAPTLSSSTVSQADPISGTGAPSAVVSLTVSGTTYQTTVAGNGSWSVPAPSSLWSTGNPSVSVVETDQASFSSPAATTGVSAGNYSVSTTTNSTLAITAVATPSILSPVMGLLTNDMTPTFSGTGEAGATVTVKDAANTTVCTATVAGDGSWTCTPSSALTDGSWTFTALQTYAGTSASTPSPSVTITIDATAPAAPAIATPANGSNTADSTPTFSGTGEAGATVTVKEGATTACTTTVAGDGSWTCTLASLSSGSHTFVTTQTDSANNTSSAGTTIMITIGAVTSSFDFSTLNSPEHTTVAAAKLTVTSETCYDVVGGSTAIVGSSGLTVTESDVAIVGGIKYNLSCTSGGGTADAVMALGLHVTDTSKLRIYKSTGSTLQDITSQVTVVNKTVDGATVTTVGYTLVDGGAFDEDGVANGVIVDPLYIGFVGGVPGTTATANSGGGLVDTGIHWIPTVVAAAGMITLSTYIFRRSRRFYRLSH